MELKTLKNKAAKAQENLSEANEKYCFCLKTWKAKALLLALCNIFFAVVAFFGPAWAMIDFCAYTDLTFKAQGSNLTIGMGECITYIGWSLIDGNTLIYGDGKPLDEDDCDDFEDEVPGIEVFKLNVNGTLELVDRIFVPEDNYTVFGFFGEEFSTALHASRGFAMLTVLVVLLLPFVGFHRPAYATLFSLFALFTCILAAGVYILSDEAETLEERNEALVGDLDCDELDDEENCEDKVFRRFGYAYAGALTLMLGLFLQVICYRQQMKSLPSSNVVEMKDAASIEAQVLQVGAPEVGGKQMSL